MTPLFRPHRSGCLAHSSGRGSPALRIQLRRTHARPTWAHFGKTPLMPSAPARRLGIGDETVAEEACRCFGLGGDLDTGSFLSRPETTLMVVEVDGGVVGWVYGHELAHPDGERTMLLYALDVAEQHRGRGYGSALVRAFVREGRRPGMYRGLGPHRARQRGCHGDVRVRGWDAWPWRSGHGHLEAR
jgi:GNAT superfamily N-acetyltransferase